MHDLILYGFMPSARCADRIWKIEAALHLLRGYAHAQCVYVFCVCALDRPQIWLQTTMPVS